MALSIETLAVAKKYTDDSIAGGGALKGKNCVITSIESITGGHRVTFQWTLDNGTVQTDTMNVMDGADGQDGEDGKGIQSVSVNENNHLIITYSDGTTTDAGQIEIHSAVDSVNGKTGDVTLDAEDVGALPASTPIPSKTSDLTNDSGFITSADVPSKTSDLTNDSGFITKAVNDLVNYYLKSETYSKTQVDDIITAVKNSRFEVVATLPTTDIKTNVIYLVPKSPSQTSNVKDEYINLDGTTAGWEKIGDTEIDLSNYVTTQALNTALAAYTTTADLTTLLAAKQDTLTFDNVPTENSNNPVQSGGVYTSEQNIYAANGILGAKNLLPFDLSAIKANNTYGTWSNNVYSYNGIDYTVNDDGSVTISGTATAGGFIYLSYENISLDNLLATCEGITSNTSGIYLAINKIGGETSNVYKDNLSALLNGTMNYTRIYIDNGYTFTNLTVYPMLRLASDTDATYQPYAKTNKQLSEDSVDWDSESRLGAVNYCPYKQGSDTNNNVSISTDENGVVSVSASAAASANTYYYLDVASKYGDISGFVLPAGTYKLKVDAENASLENYDIQLINVTDGGTLIINTITSAVFTIAAGKTIRARVRVKSGQTPSSVKFYPMITLIDYNGPYVPYSKTNRALTVDSLGLNDFCKLGAVNLLENTGVSTTTIRDVIFTKNADGSVTANGTQDGTGGGSYYHVSDTFTCDSGTYKLTGCPSGGSSSTYRLYVYDHTVGSTGEVVNASDTGEGAIFNLLSGHEYNINIMIGVSQTANDMLFKPMITPILDYNGPYVPYAKTNKELTKKVDAIGTVKYINLTINSDIATDGTITVSAMHVGNGEWLMKVPPLHLKTGINIRNLIANHVDLITLPSGYRVIDVSPAAFYFVNDNSSLGYLQLRYRWSAYGLQLYGIDTDMNDYVESYTGGDVFISSITACVTIEEV